MARTELDRPVVRRRHRTSLVQIDRRRLERVGWRTTLEFRENHVRTDTGQLLEVESRWVAEAERNGLVLSATARSETRAWSLIASGAEREISMIATA